MAQRGVEHIIWTVRAILSLGAKSGKTQASLAERIETKIGP
jgi:hypothetical protein